MIAAACVASAITLIAFLLGHDGGTAEKLPLGPLGVSTPAATETTMPVQVIPAGWWQAARSRGPWSLMHCSVAPGSDFEHFRLLADLPRAAHPSGVLMELLELVLTWTQHNSELDCR